MNPSPFFHPGPGSDKTRVVFDEDGLKRESSAPCQLNCPAGIDIPSFVTLVGHGRPEEAIEVIRQDNPFPWVCGLVCPGLCESWCQRRHLDKPLAIRHLEAMAAKFTLEKRGGYRNPVPKNRYEEKVAVIGSGPAGLTAAYFLAVEGYPVTVFEAMQEPGGLLAVGIPEFRLPKDIVRKEIAAIRDLGVEIVLNSPVGTDLTLDRLRKEGYRAFFLGIGAWECLESDFQLAPDCGEVSDVLTFLKEVSFGQRANLVSPVIIVGADRATVDAARTCIRLGSKPVSVISRRSRFETPTHVEEILQAAEEGVDFRQLTMVMRTRGTLGNLESVDCTLTELGDPDQTGRRRPTPIPSSRFRMPVGTLFFSVGRRPKMKDYPGLGEIELRPTGMLRVRGHSQRTSIPDVFAGGDAVTGPATVVEAIGAGKTAAVAIQAYLRGRPLPRRLVPRPRLAVEPIPMDYHEKAFIQRQEIPVIDMHRRISTFDQVEGELDEHAAFFEARRCMRCDVCERCGICAQVCVEKLGLSGIEFYHAGERSLILKDYVHGLPYCIGCGTCANVCPTGALRIEDKDGERRILMCGTTINKLHLMKCESCGNDFVPKPTARHIERLVQGAGGRLSVTRCPQCRRVRGAAMIAHGTADLTNPEVAKILKHRTVC